MLTFIETLQPSARAVRLRYHGKRPVIDVPFAESKELIGGFCMVQMRSLDEVLEWCNRFANIIGEDLEIDVHPAAKHRTLLERGNRRCAGRMPPRAAGRWLADRPDQVAT